MKKMDKNPNPSIRFMKTTATLEINLTVNIYNAINTYKTRSESFNVNRFRNFTVHNEEEHEIKLY